ncbi:hypothetical protein GUJ93_ZPchr0006g46392 [Zizania palustris]|uniref:Uncharacterized protein n=1 Tax=Zizania palustris TaxID=103762 RepID=A0A8J5SXW4_ZIZPA|nr:hypothetical protein GUJ93_ZPchr0006g46392 [Zizania palustris]
MAIAAARRNLGRGLLPPCGSQRPDRVIARLVTEPECRVEAMVEEVSSSSSPAALWEPLAAAPLPLRASSPSKARLLLEWKLEKLIKEAIHDCFVRLNKLDDAEMVFEEENCFENKPDFAILDTKFELLSRRTLMGKIVELGQLLSLIQDMEHAIFRMLDNGMIFTRSEGLFNPSDISFSFPAVC